MRFKIAILFLFLFNLLSYSQDELVVISSVSKDSIGFFDVIEINYEANSNEADFIEPKFNDFEIYKGKTTSTGITYKNGIKTSKSVYSYTLKPKKTGKLLIEKGVFNFNQKNYETNSIEIFVKGNTVENDALNKKNNIFIVAEISNYEPYKYQSISVDYKLYYEDKYKPTSVEFDFEKEYLKQFLIYSIETKDSIFKEKYNDIEYNCIVIRKDVLRFKELYDTYIHNKIIVNYDQLLYNENNESIKRISKKILPVVSKSIKVKSFNSNITFPHEIKSFGDYKIDVIVPKKLNVRKNKIIEIVVQLYGEGYIETELIPKLYIHEAFEIISDDIKNDRTLENKVVKSVATRTYKIKPLYEGEYVFYPTYFYFYNDKTNDKKAINTKEFTLKVN